MTAHRLLVRPGPPLRGSVTPPGDKSITHRAFLLASLANGACRIDHANTGLDCGSTLACLEALGISVSVGGASEADGTRVESSDAGPPTIVITGRDFRFSESERVLDCGNSGTTLRLLAGVLAGQPFLSVMAGDESLNRRPVRRVIEPLRAMGAMLVAREDDRVPPLVIRGRSLRGIDYLLPVASAQVASCVLFAGLHAEGETAVAIPGPARDHTERMLAGLGVPIHTEPLPGGGRRVRVRRLGAISPFDFRVPGDFSSAAFFLAAAAARPGARVTAFGIGLNPTRTGLLDCLERMGAEVRRDRVRLESGEEVGDVTVEGPDHLQGTVVPPEWVPRMIDEVPAWAIAAAAARGNSRLTGAAELRVKESDRLGMLARNLGALGISTRETPDGIEIEGGRVEGGVVEGAGDHRIAMAFAAIGTLAAAPVEVRDAGSIATSYPEFAATLRSLGGTIDEA